MRKPLFKQITIIGVGLVGGSLAKAIHQRGLSERLYGICRDARGAKRIHRFSPDCVPVVGFDPGVLGSSDLVIVATTVNSIIESFDKLRSTVRPGTTVMDVGSTKVQIEKAARRLPKGVTFIGAHPMAGSEKRGPENADPDLFEGALCFVLKNAPLKARKRCEAFWKALGAHVELITSEAHDKITAKVSHLPHVVSTALLTTILRGADRKTLHYGGPGLAGMIRIAGANPEMWVDIFDSNRRWVRQELKSLIHELQRFDKVLAKKDAAVLLKLLMSTHRFKQYTK